MKLIDYVQKIPRPALVRLIGDEVIQGLQFNNIGRTQKEISELLIEMLGNDFFKHHELRKLLIFTFNETDLKFFKEKCSLEGDNDGIRNHLLKTKIWTRNELCKAFIDFFDLTELDFFEPEDDSKNAMEIIVPRISTTETYFEGLKIFIPNTYPLHAYQKNTKDALITKLLEKSPPPKLLLHMPTGSGKTKTAIEAIVDFWRVKGQNSGFIVWLTHSKELCEQAYETFKEIWQAKGDTSIAMFKLFENFEPEIEKHKEGIVFLGFQKFHNHFKNLTDIALHLRNNTRLVIVDEAHVSSAKTYKDTIKYLTENGASLLGLTATPGRDTKENSKENQVLASLYNSNLVSIIDEYKGKPDDPIKYLQDNGFLAKLNRIEIKSELTFSEEELQRINNEDIDLPKDILLKLSLDLIRNKNIVHEIKKAVIERKDPTLVFSTSITHATILKILLRIEGVDAECVFGNTPSSLRKKHIIRFKSNNLPVLINYGVLSTGFDAPNIRTLVIARPTASIVLYSQMIGRALRGPKMGGKSNINTLIDVRDNYGRLGTTNGAFNFFNHYFR